MRPLYHKSPCQIRILVWYLQVRDWSPDGEVERQTSYQRILDKLEQLYPVAERDTRKVLVPGAGLGMDLIRVNG